MKWGRKENEIIADLDTIDTTIQQLFIIIPTTTTCTWEGGHFVLATSGVLP